MTFESDPNKEFTNLTKHHVTFQQAYRAIQDPDKIKIYDHVHFGYNKYGIWESRWKVIGKSGKRILFVSYCERNGGIRIISSRRANKAMRRKYKAMKEGNEL